MAAGRRTLIQMVSRLAPRIDTASTRRPADPAHSGAGGKHDGEHRTQKDEVCGRSQAQSKPEDGHGDPGQRGNGAHEIDHGHDHGPGLRACAQHQSQRQHPRARPRSPLTAHAAGCTTRAGATAAREACPRYTGRENPAPPPAERRASPERQGPSNRRPAIRTLPQQRNKENGESSAGGLRGFASQEFPGEALGVSDLYIAECPEKADEFLLSFKTEPVGIS